MPTVSTWTVSVLLLLSLLHRTAEASAVEGSLAAIPLQSFPHQKVSLASLLVPLRSTLLLSPGIARIAGLVRWLSSVPMNLHTSWVLCLHVFPSALTQSGELLKTTLYSDTKGAMHHFNYSNSLRRLVEHHLASFAFFIYFLLLWEKLLQVYLEIELNYSCKYNKNLGKGFCDSHELPSVRITSHINLQIITGIHQPEQRSHGINAQPPLVLTLQRAPTPDRESGWAAPNQEARVPTAINPDLKRLKLHFH